MQEQCRQSFLLLSNDSTGLVMFNKQGCQEDVAELPRPAGRGGGQEAPGRGRRGEGRSDRPQDQGCLG